ncbi:MAG: Maf family protein [Coriobacteriia bacterium]|nr:Maf family protein [Coriobacteriia bacterium]
MAVMIHREPLSRIVLASQSPRRRRLLAWLELPFEADAVDTPEDLDTPLAADPGALASHLAAEKACVAREEGLGADGLILAFDTLVVHEGAVLGKPRDERDAWRMLKSLSGRTHEVVTGCALLGPHDPEPRVFSVKTQVQMKELTDCRIEAWMAMGTYLGCAGAYNIEAQVASVAGDECFQNVAGLPLCHLFVAVREEFANGRIISEPAPPVCACDSALQRTCVLGPRTIDG